MHRRFYALLFTLCLFICPRLRAADEPPRDDLNYDIRWELPVTLGAAGFWLGTELAKPDLAPKDCRVCEPNRFDALGRKALAWKDPALASKLSDIALYGVAPVAVLGTGALVAHSNDRLEQYGRDLLLVAEAVAVSQALNQGMKLVVGRERPYAHDLGPEAETVVNRPEENNLSFYSGHTNLAFALTASTATVARMRGYRGANWIWAVGLPIAATVAWLRVGADKHYVTDVLAGAALGTATGVLIPAIHDWGAFKRGGPSSPSVSLSPTLGGFKASVSFRW